MSNFFKKIKALFVKSETPKTSMQKTARAAILIGAVVLIALILYFAVIFPLTRNKTAEPPELLPGEVFENGVIYMLPQYDRTEISKIEVQNEIEHFTLLADVKGAEVSFHIEGKEEILLSPDSVSYFLADVRSLLTSPLPGQDRVNDYATEEDLKNYGLDKDSNPAWFEVTLVDGSSYRVYVGKSLVTTKGYYAMLDGRKNTKTDENGVETAYDVVYCLQPTLSESVLAGSNKLITKELSPMMQDITKTSLFSIQKYKGEERKPVCMIGLVNDIGISASSQVYEMKYPAAYVVNEDNYIEHVLSVLGNVMAEEIVAYGENIHDPAVYEKYGLDLDMERLDTLTDKNYAMVYYTDDKLASEDQLDGLTFLYFSEKQTDTTGMEFYYVYSPMREAIGKVSAETFEFIEWDLAKYTNPYLYFEYFTSCDYFEMVSPRFNLNHRFTLSGKERTRVANVTTAGDSGDVIYKTLPNGDKIPLVYRAEYKTDVAGVEYIGEFENLRDLYYVLITRSLALYADVDETVTKKGESPVATLQIKTSPKDHPITYRQYDKDGNPGRELRDEGGNILCHKVSVPTKLSDGTITNIEYDKAFYDETSGRFFLKAVDSFDGNEKPSGFIGTDTGSVKVTLFLPETAYGEYVETVYSYEFYDMFDTYTDASGKEIHQLNSTYMYMIPTVTENLYSVTSGGEKTLQSSTVSRAEEGVYVRTATMDKLFSDANKCLNGEKIDTMGVN